MPNINNKPLVSIVTPLYNHEHYIVDCLLKDSIQSRLLCMEKNSGCRAVIDNCIAISDSGDKVHDSAISGLSKAPEIPFQTNSSSSQSLSLDGLQNLWQKPLYLIRRISSYREGLGTEYRESFWVHSSLVSSHSG